MASWQAGRGNKPASKICSKNVLENILLGVHCVLRPLIRRIPQETIQHGSLSGLGTNQEADIDPESQSQVSPVQATADKCSINSMVS